MDKKPDRYHLAEQLDPHHLAALMSFTFANQQDGSLGLEPPSQLVKHGVTDDHSTSVRTFPVLDAIAGISISEVESRVVAVALQLNSQTQEIHLTIAANQMDKEKLVSHLTAVWGKLQTLSNAYAEERGGKSNLCGRGSPDIPAGVAYPLRVEIFRDIYQFCMGKQMKRMKKWLKGLISFMQHLVQRRGDADLKGTDLNLHYVVVGLFTVLQFFMRLHDNPGTQLADREWEEIYMHTMWATENATIALKDRNRCETLAQEIKDCCTGDRFQLRRALEKLTFLARRVDSLISFAHSPRLRPALQYAISISTVPELTRTVKLPRSREQWQSILEVACTERADWQREKAEELLKKFESEECMCPLHPECGLIQYLETKRDGPWDDIPPFTYIGVSRLSCSGCRNWITAFNRLGGRQFYIGGTSGKWYWPWGMPMGEESLGKIMARRVSRQYLAYQDLRSQSARSSLVRAQPLLSAAERERIFARILAEQNYGDTPLEWLEGALSAWRDRMRLSK
ncbi:hypothetical protein C7212DRAFT_346849 [Tuber magnatum]|uniref:Uncharacterized protein n=1 Tax=Tuber magnatum TaxID=42249 RepID=A0A317SI97_9PEZI|nr:hypothetical protein C7212DRAFT_346849 [Tuber magnatum]